jgi:hypothetical protein
VNGLLDLARAEVLKLRSTRTAVGLLAAALLVSLLPAVLFMALAPRDVLDGDGSAAAAYGLTIVPILAVVFGILGMTNEYRHGTITSTYLATPRRWIVIAVKLVAYGVTGMLLVVIAIRIVGGLRGIEMGWLDATSVGQGETARDVALFLLTVGLMTAFGVALGALFRLQVPTVAGTLVWALAIENIILVVRPGVGRYLPFIAFQQLNVGGGSGDLAVQMLSRPQAFLLGLAYIGIASVAAVFLSMRRDVT